MISGIYFAPEPNQTLIGTSTGWRTLPVAGDVSLAGSTLSIGDGKVATAMLADGCVSSDKLQDDSVTLAKIQNASIGGAVIVPKSIARAKLAQYGSTKIDDFAVTAQKLGFLIPTSLMSQGSINSENVYLGVGNGDIAAGAITDSIIRSSSISGTSLAPAAVTTAKIRDLAITTAVIADASFPATNISASSITNIQLQPNSVTTDKLATNSVSSSALPSNAVVARHLAGPFDLANFGILNASKVQGTVTNSFNTTTIKYSNNATGSGPVCGTQTALTIDTPGLYLKTPSSDSLGFSCDASSGSMGLVGKSTTAKRLWMFDNTDGEFAQRWYINNANIMSLSSTNLSLTLTTGVSNLNTGAIRLAGGMGIAKRLNSSGMLHVNALVASASGQGMTVGPNSITFSGTSPSVTIAKPIIIPSTLTSGDLKIGDVKTTVITTPSMTVGTTSINANVLSVAGPSFTMTPAVHNSFQPVAGFVVRSDLSFELKSMSGVWNLVPATVGSVSAILNQGNPGTYLIFGCINFNATATSFARSLDIKVFEYDDGTGNPNSVTTHLVSSNTANADSVYFTYMARNAFAITCGFYNVFTISESAWTIIKLF